MPLPVRRGEAFAIAGFAGCSSCQEAAEFLASPDLGLAPVARARPGAAFAAEALGLPQSTFLAFAGEKVLAAVVAGASLQGVGPAASQVVAGQNLEDLGGCEILSLSHPSASEARG
jgi:hypothetical protein